MTKKDRAAVERLLRRMEQLRAANNRDQYRVLRKRLGEKLQVLRRAAGLPQWCVGERIGRDQSYMHGLESRGVNPNPALVTEVLEAIARGKSKSK